MPRRLPAAAQVGEAELQALVEALDVRHSGVIEYDEFLAGRLAA